MHDLAETAERMDEEDALWTSCPRCDAPPGDECQPTSNWDTCAKTGPHKARIKARQMDVTSQNVI